MAEDIEDVCFGSMLSKKDFAAKVH